MRAVLQRVARASVSWAEADGERREEIGSGLLVLIGGAPGDTPAAVARLADKVAALRIFADSAGRFDRSLEEVGGEALVVSQFTLFADLSGGRRPSFTGAAAPGPAAELCDRFAARLRERGVKTRTGAFGASMTVSLDNVGPVTVVVSTDPWNPSIGG